LIAYPRLIVKYLRIPHHDAVFVPYMGHFDVLLLRPMASMRHIPIIWDAFLSLWDTIVLDRRMLDQRHFLARLLHWLEEYACHAADMVVLDTKAHAHFFCETYGLSLHKTSAVFVGAEADSFPLLPPRKRDPNAPVRVLFYGQFIPLHGIPTIIEGARLAQRKPIDWVLIGKGQEEDRIKIKIRASSTLRLQWIPWVRYEDLIKEIAEADVCLGIFGTSEKASRVIPNKVFQILSCGRPLVTRDSPAIQELVAPDTPGVELVPPANPAALVAAVEDLARSNRQPPHHLRDAFTTVSIGLKMVDIIEMTTQSMTSRKERPRNQS
ncbi:MAG: glycosyltransferase, partial [Candidatus Zixiibacteriota bacterium]